MPRAECQSSIGMPSGIPSVTGRGSNSMTNRYSLLIEAIRISDLSIVRMFLFAAIAVLSYASLTWTPAWLRRPARAAFKALALIEFIFITVYSAMQ